MRFFAVFALVWRVAAASAPGCEGAMAAAAGATLDDGGYGRYSTGGEPVEGALTSVGSDSLNGLMERWVEGFRRHSPGVEADVTGKGSATAIPALLDGVADLGPMSRLPKPAELERWSVDRRYPPVSIPVAVDAVAVFVNEANPVAARGLTLAELDAVFSSTRNRGGPAAIDRWGQLGVGVGAEAFADAPVALYGPNAASVHYASFKRLALSQGEFRPGFREAPSAPNTTAPARDAKGISFGPVGTRAADLARVPVAATDLADTSLPSARAVVDGAYPLGRILYIAVRDPRDRPIPATLREFLRFIYSADGQEIVAEAGFLPVPQPLASRHATEIGIRLPGR